jgi:hypothetical protein
LRRTATDAVANSFTDCESNEFADACTDIF